MTSYTQIYDRFFRRIEKDMTFFSRVGLIKEECMEVAREQARGYMDEALAELMMDCRPEVDFDDRDDIAAVFRFDLTSREKYLIALLMFKHYVHRDIAYIKTLEANYVDTSLRVFSPSEARDTWKDLYAMVCRECDEAKETYRNTSRDTGFFVGIDYTQSYALSTDE